MVAFTGHYLLLSCIVFNALAIIWPGVWVQSLRIGSLKTKQFGMQQLGTPPFGVSPLRNLNFVSCSTNSLKITLFITACILPIAAFLLLEYAFLTSDFTLRVVFFYSSNTLPTIYKIASGWASHESSMLLWFAMLSAISLSLLLKLKKHHDIYVQNFMIIIASFVQLLFCAFILKTSSPFEMLYVEAKQGMGMNPMLQDMAVAIHPPVLYLGFVSLFGVFLCSLLILKQPNSWQSLFNICRNYTLLALALLTVGIGLGGWWAYRELGWGGYWYFDPVENISLLPWISGIVLHHYLLFAVNKGRFAKSTIFFGIFSFIITLYGFFFIRSGIISSVHSFAFSPERGAYILVICLIITIMSYTYFFVRIKQVMNNIIVESGSSLERGSSLSGSSTKLDQIVHFSNYLWVAALFALLIAIIYPIYYTMWFDIEIAIDPTYYHKIFVPIFIPILLFAGIAPSFTNQKFQRNILLLILAILLAFPIVVVKDPGEVIILVLIMAIFLMVSSIDYVFTAQRANVKRYVLKDFAPEDSNISRKLILTNRQIAVFLGHFGSGMLAFSICINVIFSTQVNFSGSKGDSAIGDDLAVRLDDVSFAENDVYYRQIAKFVLQDAHDNNSIVLKPENRLYKIENTLSQEADIFSFISHDLYAVITSVQNKTVIAEIHYKPMISFIWLSILLISLGFVASLSARV